VTNLRPKTPQNRCSVAFHSQVGSFGRPELQKAMKNKALVYDLDQNSSHSKSVLE
jgi:hypothetical protein